MRRFSGGLWGYRPSIIAKRCDNREKFTNQHLYVGAQCDKIMRKGVTPCLVTCGFENPN